MTKLLNYEELRRHTFVNWPANGAPNKNILAGNGFYATGKYMEIKCNWCGLVIKDFPENTETIEQTHKKASQFCEFLRNPYGCGNVIQLQEDKELYIEANRLATFTNWPNRHITPEKLAKAGFYYLQRADEVQCAWCNGVIAMWEENDDAFREHRRFFPECPRVQFGPLVEITNGTNLMNLGVQKLRPPTHPAYTSLDARLRTFANWPIPEIQLPKRLAKAGLYYENVADQVQCFHCSIGLRSWQPTDDPWFEHARWYPDCTFVLLAKGLNYVQRVREIAAQEQTEQADAPACEQPNRTIMPLNGAAASTTTATSDDASGNLQQDSSKLQAAACANGETQQLTAELVDINLSSFDVRLRTFENWPASNILKPEKLAEAGFYYRKTRDTVRCFSCQINLQDWHKDDDPWIEHIKFNPTCKFVIYQKGQNFIQQVQTRMDPHSLARMPPKMQLDVAMKTTPVLIALEMGFDPTLVRHVAEARLVSYDNASFTVQGFLKDIYELTAGQQQVAESTQTAVSTSANSSLNRSFDTPEILPETSSNAASTSVKLLEDENRRLKEARTCKVCLDQEVSIVFLPCGHLVTCQQCAPGVLQCPICRTDINAYVRAFLS